MDYARLYHYRFKNIKQIGREAVWVEIADYIYKRLGKPKLILDPACGRMEFINAVPSEEKWAADVFIAENTAKPGVQQRLGNVFDIELPNNYFDAIFVSNFLEHLLSIEQVHEFLKRAKTWLRPGGKIVIMGPNFRHCMKEYYDCADHTLALTHISVSEHLYAAGFEIEAIHSRFLPFSFRSIFPASRVFTSLYLRFPIFWRLLGKQFLIIGNKSD